MGALFLVSPALNPEVARVAQGAGVPYLPGVLTPREVEEALALGLTLLKFFPAEAFQGAAVLRAYAEVFPEARFVPTGGIREENLKRYASLPNLLAVGGSWLLEGSPRKSSPGSSPPGPSSTPKLTADPLGSFLDLPGYFRNPSLVQINSGRGHAYRGHHLPSGIQDGSRHTPDSRLVLLQV